MRRYLPLRLLLACQSSGERSGGNVELVEGDSSQDPHHTDYYGNREVGSFLQRLMAPGATRPWQEVLRETTGRELDGKAMAEYFQPLQVWLQEQNRGRKATLPDL